MPKVWYLSKTIWLNVVSFLLVVLALPEFIHVIPTVVLPYVALLNAAGNAWLRSTSTNAPLTLTTPQQ